MFVFAAQTLAIWNSRRYGQINNIFAFRIWDARFEVLRFEIMKTDRSSGTWCLRIWGLNITCDWPSSTDGVGTSHLKLIWLMGAKALVIYIYIYICPIRYTLHSMLYTLHSAIRFSPPRAPRGYHTSLIILLKLVIHTSTTSNDSMLLTT